MTQIAQPCILPANAEEQKDGYDEEELDEGEKERGKLAQDKVKDEISEESDLMK